MTEPLFHDPILTGVVRQDGDATARDERCDGLVDAVTENPKLIVHLDAQRLEGALGRVTAVSPGGRRDRAANDLSEHGSRGDRPVGHDAAGDPGCVTFVAVDPKHPGDLAFGPMIDDLVCGEGGPGIHPHVEWALGSVTEPPLGPVELRGGHAEVEQHPDDRFGPLICDRLGELIEPAVAQANSVSLGGESVTGGGQRIGILVEA
jgi:hypothetical protein